jgi:L-ribulokinase
MDASVRMARLRDESYHPVPENKAVYDNLFTEYVTLHDYFGRGTNDVMKRLKTIKADARKV